MKRGRADIQRQISVDDSATVNARHEDESRPTEVHIGIQDPQVGSEIDVDVRAYIEELTRIVEMRLSTVVMPVRVGYTSSKEQGESRKSREKTHTKNESKQLGRTKGNVKGGGSWERGQNERLVL
jgi:hypothetical protein